jgi:hypothetical protein
MSVGAAQPAIDCQPKALRAFRNQHRVHKGVVHFELLTALVTFQPAPLAPVGPATISTAEIETPNINPNDAFAIA